MSAACQKRSSTHSDGSAISHFQFDDGDDAMWMDEQTVSGFLYKASGREKNKPKRFQKRWFRLSSCGLSYYKTKEDVKPLKPQIALSEILHLHNADEITKREFSMELVTPTRNYFFLASSEEDRKVWKESMDFFKKISLSDDSSENSIFSVSDSEDSFHPEAQIVSLQVHLQERETSSPQSSCYSYQDEFLTSDFETNTPTYEGYLWKTPGNKKSAGNWQKRWFVVTHGIVQYFKHQTSQKEAGFFHVGDILHSEICEQDTTKNRYRFDIETQHRTYFLFAESEEERNQWISWLTPTFLGPGSLDTFGDYFVM